MSHHPPEGATSVARYPHNVNIAFAGLGGLGCGCTAPSMGSAPSNLRRQLAMSGLGEDEIAALEAQVQQHESDVAATQERKKLFPYFAAFMVGIAVGRAWR